MTTYPGVNNSFNMAAFPVNEQAAIRKLAKYFYITRAADSVQIGNSDYRALLMRPSDEISVALNVERELIVLFADYETFEARTFVAFDKTFEKIDDVRIDRSVRFLISRDKQIEDRVRHYLNQHPEYPIVIPLKYSDFEKKNADFIFDSIRKNHLIRNLFGFQSPLKQEYFFFGRTKLVKDTIDLHRSGQNSGLFGLRKSGKTSTIYAIQRHAKALGCRTLLIDCQDPAVHAKRFSGLLEHILVEVRRELGQRKIEINLGRLTDQISENFRKLMTRTLNDAQNDCLLIFDEIENISPKTAASSHWRDQNDTLIFWQILRSFFQQTNTRKLTFCFVGTNPHLFELPKINDVDNPVYLFAPKTYIPMLSLQETDQMIRRLGYFMGLDFSGSVIASIHNRFGGHPFFIRQVCSQIHNQVSTQSRPTEVSLKTASAAEQNANSDIKNYLTEILQTLRNFYPDEYTMLEYLAEGNQNTFNELADYSNCYIEHLIGYGIIVRRGEDYEFSFDAVAEATKKNLIKSTSSSIEEKWSNSTVRRNRLEQEIRVFLFRKTSFSSDEFWQEAFVNCLSGKRFQEIGKLTRREAFSRNNSPLYFSELIQFIRTFCDGGIGAYSISAISGHLDLINKFRIDAHAKDISDSDLNRLLNAFDYLEEIFLTPE